MELCCGPRDLPDAILNTMQCRCNWSLCNCTCSDCNCPSANDAKMDRLAAQSYLNKLEKEGKKNREELLKQQET